MIEVLNPTIARALQAYLHADVDEVIESLAEAWFAAAEYNPNTAKSILHVLESYLREERVKIFEEKYGDLGVVTPSQVAEMDPPAEEFGRLVKISNFYKLGNVFVMMYLHAFLLKVRGVQTPLEDFRKIVDDLDPR